MKIICIDNCFGGVFMYIKPKINSYDVNVICENIGPLQTQYSLNLWFQQVSSQEAMLNKRTEKIQYPAVKKETTVYRHKKIT